MRATSCGSCTTAWPTRGATLGETAVGFQKFAHLVTSQVAELRRRGSPEVAFRVAVRNGKVSFTARGLKGVTSGGLSAGRRWEAPGGLRSVRRAW